jgi:hypothetical protein
VLDEELRAEALKRLLDALVAACVCKLQDVRKNCRGTGHKHTPFVEDEAVVDALGVAVVARGNGVLVRPQLYGSVQLAAEVGEQLERGHRDLPRGLVRQRQDRQKQNIAVTTRKSISDSVEAAWAIFQPEVEAE